MHGTTSLTFIDAKQAKDIYLYKNFRRKLYRTNASIWYNKMWRQRKLTPAYKNIRINGNNQQCQKTQKTANQYRISQEINFLYIKKIKLSEQLFKLHLKCADNWQRTWHHNTIHRLQANKGDGNPLQHPKPQTRQAAKGNTNQEKNRHITPTQTILR